MMITATTLVDRTYIQYDLNVGNYLNIDLSHVYNPLYINGDKIIEGRTIENNATNLASGQIYRVVDINGDGDLDMMGDGDLDVITQGGWYEGSVYFMENISTTPGEYNFVNRGHVHPRIIMCHEVHISTCDWNKDGIPDILCGDISGNVYYFKNDKQTTN